jgi:hypothetical protein
MHCVPECPAQVEDVEYGDGVGKDNVVKCKYWSGYWSGNESDSLWSEIWSEICLRGIRFVDKLKRWQMFPTMADFARRANISIENKITNNQKNLRRRFITIKIGWRQPNQKS